MMLRVEKIEEGKLTSHPPVKPSLKHVDPLMFQVFQDARHLVSRSNYYVAVSRKDWELPNSRM